jgi:hypothetical protein
LLSVVASVSVLDTVVLSLVALGMRLNAAPPIKRRVDVAMAFGFATASFNLPPSFPFTSALFVLLLVTKPVTSTNTSLFLLTPASSLVESDAIDLALEAAVDPVARADVAVVAAPSLERELSRDGRALAFSLSLVDRATRTVLLTYYAEVRR